MHRRALHRRGYLSLAAGAVGGLTAGCLDGSTATEMFAVDTVVEGLAQPWAMAFTDDDSLLVTERDAGALLRVDPDSGRTAELDGVPSVDSRGQGGLLDVTLGPDGWTYLTYSVATGAGATTTRLGRGRLADGEGDDGDRLTDFEVLYTAEPSVDSGGHYGSRVVVGPDGLLYVTVGDRQFKNFGPEHVAQDLRNDLGTTLRLRPDGSIPENNPFVDSEERSSSDSRTQSGDSDERDAIYSYGHRNAQGLAIQPGTGAVWESEFGERDGDEMNRIEAGGNYGWPVADEGCTYGSGEPIGVSHADRADVVGPALSWPCGSGGFPPSGTAFYDGDAVPDWRGDLFVGGLASRSLARLRVDGDREREVERLLADRNERLRAVAVAPDTGVLHVAVDAGDAPVLALVPA